MGKWQDNLSELVADFATPEIRGRFPTILLIVIQLLIFWVSLYWVEISAFCTATKSDAWTWLGYIHLLFLPLLVLGFVSAYVPKCRPFYITLLCLGLAVLPLQLWLLRNGSLYCDTL